MKPRAGEQFNIRFGDGLDGQTMDEICIRHDLPRSTLAREGVLLFKYMSPEFYKKLLSFADSMATKPGLVIEATILRRLAEIQAEIEVWGGGGILEEFIATNAGPVTGDELHAHLLQHFRQKTVNERYTTLKALVAAGAPVVADDQEFLDTYGLKL